MSEKLIIIGAVAAGTKVAAKAKREDPSLEVVVYTSDTNISYAGCGLPYYIGKDIEDKDLLLAKTPQEFEAIDEIKIYIKHKVTAINTSKNEIEIHDLSSGRSFVDNYDTLVIATGAVPIIPNIEGCDLTNVYKIRNVEDALDIREKIESESIQDVVIVGAGYIGLEMAEAFTNYDVSITIVEFASQILSTIDADMADIIEQHLQSKGVKILKNTKVEKIIGNNKGFVRGVIASGNALEADMVILAVGVRPNVELATKAGIDLGTTGAIKVNKKMQTNIQNIYSAGDCVETTNLITQQPAWIPLGSTANKQGRVAAINITGGESEFEGILGSMIVKVCDMSVAKTGLSVKEAYKHNLEFDFHFQSTVSDDLTQTFIQMLVEKSTKRIIGTTVVSNGNADKIIDFIVMAITTKIALNEFISCLESLLDEDIKILLPISKHLLRI